MLGKLLHELKVRKCRNKMRNCQQTTTTIEAFIKFSSSQEHKYIQNHYSCHPLSFPILIKVLFRIILTQSQMQPPHTINSMSDGSVASYLKLLLSMLSYESSSAIKEEKEERKIHVQVKPGKFSTKPPSHTTTSATETTPLSPSSACSLVLNVLESVAAG